MTRGLTEKQEKILQFIESYVDEKDYPPSIREIGNHFNISSLRGVTVHLDALERKNYIKRANTARGITVLHRQKDKVSLRDVVMVPKIGAVGAGDNILGTDNIEGYIPVPSELVGNVDKPVAVEVIGDSMINAHIMPRDLVIVKLQQDWRNGDIVVARVGEEAMVKTIRETNNGVFLISENPAYDPIPIRHENSKVIGKVIGLIRNYDSAAAL